MLVNTGTSHNHPNTSLFTCMCKGKSRSHTNTQRDTHTERERKGTAGDGKRIALPHHGLANTGSRRRLWRVCCSVGCSRCVVVWGILPEKFSAQCLTVCPFDFVCVPGVCAVRASGVLCAAYCGCTLTGRQRKKMKNTRKKTGKIKETRTGPARKFGKSNNCLLSQLDGLLTRMSWAFWYLTRSFSK